MPYKIVKQDSKFCVAKADTGLPVKGGCHPNRADAVNHLQAIMANETMAIISESFEIEDVEDTGIVAGEEIYDIGVFGDSITEEDLDTITAAFVLTERNWSGPIAYENTFTGDKRSFTTDAITWDNPPMPLLFQRMSGDGHSGSVIIGRVDEITRDGATLSARGVILEGIPEADEFLALMEHKAAGGVSVDGDSAVYEVQQAANKSQQSIEFTAMRIRGLTAVAVPAFSDAEISLDEPIAELQVEVEDKELTAEELLLADIEVEALAKKRMVNKKTKREMTWAYAQEAGITASGAPVKPPLTWFDNPKLQEPTGLTITQDGQVFGHLALHGTCHIGMRNCTTPPKGCSYRYFHTGAVETSDGPEVAVGHLTFDTGHASVYNNAADAASHYDNTGYVGADVVCGEDSHGIWFAGALRPEMSDEQVRKFRAAALSGDWRRIGGRMELVAALSVNTPGFPVPRSKALVASAAGGGLEPETIITYNEEETTLDMKDRKDFKTFLATKVRTIFSDEQCKTEGGECYGASDYAYAPDANTPSTWKLRLTDTPGGEPTPAQVGRAIAALGKGFRGNRIDIPATDLSAVTMSVKSAWLKANKDKNSSDVPAILAAIVAAGSVTKSEGDAGNFPAGDYAYVPDASAPSTWKLRLTATPGGDPDPGIVGAAIAALGKGFRGNKVDIPAADLAKVKAKVKAAWLKADPKRMEADVPSVVACGDMYGGGDEPIDGDDDLLEALLKEHEDILDLLDEYQADDPDVQSYLDKTETAVRASSAELYGLLGKLVTNPPADETDNQDNTAQAGQ